MTVTKQKMDINGIDTSDTACIVNYKFTFVS